MGMCDLKDGKGRETGYFRNESRNGDIAYGEHMADVTSDGREYTAVGTWSLISGTGLFAGVTGGGKLEVHSPDGGTVDTKWSAEYEVSR